MTWSRACWLLLALWLGAAILGVNHVNAGLFTSYGADLTQPAWLYIVTRSLDDPGRRGWLRRTFGRSPELAAGAIFLGAALTEFSQLLWPRGPMAGVFDPLDVAAYAAGLLPCYLIERRQLRGHTAPETT